MERYTMEKVSDYVLGQMTFDENKMPQSKLAPYTLQR
jgi:hypothetical protein